MSSDAAEAVHIKYRPDVDGLRAVAVLAVVFFHLKLGCPGGYVGVDVFFVISGFLITSLLLKELRENRFSLIEFWERRVRRIMPAAAAMVFVTLALGYFLLLPQDFANLGRSTVAQAVMAANIYFWRSSDYFDTPEQKPLLHTWSLAVEEQFYIFFPIALYLLLRVPALRNQIVLCIVLSIGLAASLALSIAMISDYTSATFYLLPTRAWELLCGSLVAALPLGLVPRNRIVREFFSLLGLAGILTPIWLYSEQTLFPGLAAAPPCFGTALLIGANIPRRNEAGAIVESTIIGRILSLRAMVFVGLISYSLYLWHWPVWVFSVYWEFEALSLLHRWGLVALSFALAIASWWFIETPFRKRKLFGSRKSIFAFGVTSMALTCVFGLALRHYEGLPNRFPPDIYRLLDDVSARVERINQYPSDLAKDNLIRFGSDDPKAPIDTLLWGDSHARSAVPAFDLICKQAGVAGRAATHSATPPILDYAPTMVGSLQRDTPEFAREVVRYVRDKKIRHVFLIARWSIYNDPEVQLGERLQTTVDALENAGAKVWIVLDVPTHDAQVPRAMARAQLFGGGMTEWRTTKSEHASPNDHMLKLPSSLQSRFIDPAPAFLDETGDRYKAVEGDKPLYFDRDHLTIYGAQHYLAPVILEKIAGEYPTNTTTEPSSNNSPDQGESGKAKPEARKRLGVDSELPPRKPGD